MKLISKRLFYFLFDRTLPTKICYSKYVQINIVLLQKIIINKAEMMNFDFAYDMKFILHQPAQIITKHLSLKNNRPKIYFFS